jgi:transportin-1
MATNWTPQTDAVRQLAEVLAHSTSRDKAVRNQAKKALEDAQTQPDLDNYLTFLLVTPSDSIGQEIRATAGILLKNNLMQRYDHMAPHVQEYVKTEVAKGLIDPVALVRNVAGNVITTLVTKTGVSGWPDILARLMTMAESSNVQAQEGSLSALAKICEDSAPELDRDYNGERPLNYMVPKFLHFTSSSSSRVRSQSIFCLSQFIPLQSQSLLTHLDAFLSALFSLATDNDPDTRRNVCEAFVSLLEVRPDKLLPHLDGIINYCLHCVKDEDEQVALEGCEFILGLAESTVDHSHIQPHLAKILPMVLSTMVYSEMDRFILEGMDEEDEDKEDKPEDLRPVSAKSKEAHTVDKKGEAGDSRKESKSANYRQENELEEEEEDDELDDEEYEEQWNLRKCSAAALDVFATVFPQIVMQVSLPYLKESIVSKEWYVREAAILALGAIAEGCITDVTPQLPSLVPFLVVRLNDDHAPVRQISCWTLGRYSQWIVENSHSNHQEFFLPTLEGLLKCCLDKNKKVQESGCSAFSTFTEHAGESLSPYLEVILHQLSLCFGKYQSRNLPILYDSVQTLLEQAPSSLCEKKHIDLLLPPLIEKWSQIGDDDRELLPLLECMASVTSALGESFAPYAPAVFGRAIKILRDTLVMDQHFQADPSSVDPPEKDFVVTSIDLLDGLVQGLGHHASELISPQQPSFMEMLIVCFQDPVVEVRQSAFALLGDMAIHTFDQIDRYFTNVMDQVLPHIDSSSREASPVCNNAIWSAGEIALQARRELLEPYVQQLLQRLVSVLQSQTVSTVLENAAIAIGRLGKTLPDCVAPHLSLFIDKWCDCVMYIEETEEKDTSFQGMCRIIGTNPSALSNQTSLVKFVETAARYVEPSPPLGMLLAKVFEGYKNYVANWDEMVMNKLHPDLAASLRQRYGL